MKCTLSDFDYALPKELIAAFPPQDRPSARLLHVDRTTGKFSHHVFRDIKNFMNPGDVLVLNNTKVIPARLFGKKLTGGKVEALLLKQISEDRWQSLLRPGGRIRKGMMLEFGENGLRLQAEVLDDATPNSGERQIRFQKGTGSRNLSPSVGEILEKIGHIPLPPYIDRADTEIDREMYQTVFAEKEGAVASPTAGLHFDEALLNDLKNHGVEIVYVTLHTSYGTFQPVTEEDLSKHQMFSEDFEITEQAAAQVNKALKENRRIIACGTTVVRTLESVAKHKVPGPSDPPKGPGTLCRSKDPGPGTLVPMKGNTRLFIYPPYKFKIVSGMITNFHLPKSSLLLLVAALLGREKMFDAYAEAIRQSYRFYSYGDAMVIL